MEVEGKTAIVTGSSRGVGRAVVSLITGPDPTTGHGIPVEGGALVAG